MSRISTDIDIDFADRDAALASLVHVRASREDRGSILPHPTGVYFQDVPVDPFSGYCSISYQKAAELGYFKIDFLNNSIYQGVRDDAHLTELVNREPEWDLLDDRDIVGMLAHIRDHFGTVQSVRPRSIEDLALVLALIRPAKKHLVGRPRNEIEAEIWKPDDDGTYSFRKSHSIAYALAIVVQLNLLVEEAARQLAQ